MDLKEKDCEQMPLLSLFAGTMRLKAVIISVLITIMILIK